MIVLFGVLSLACLLYFAAILIYAGAAAAFGWVWLFLSLFFAGLALIKKAMVDKLLSIQLPLWLKVGTVTTLLLGALIFVLVEAMIVYGMTATPKQNLDYVIVLGARVKGERITSSLKKRLDRAVAYLKENPETIAVVSGGQGPGEDISEAEAMRRYLFAAGIPENRIIKEYRSTTTVENISFSKSFITLNWYSRMGGYTNVEPQIGVISNNFHIFRAVKIGEKMGIPLSGIPAESDKLLLANQMLREFFAIVKEKFVGNI